MIRTGHWWLAALILAAGATIGAAAATPNGAALRILASHPVGTFLENMLVEPDGSVLYTSYFDRTIWRHRPDGTNMKFATLEAHPVSVARRGNSIWVVAQTASFADGPAFMKSNQIMRLDRDGRAVETVPLPQASFLNGTADLPGGDLLIADSVAGVIWRFSTARRTLSVWLRDPLLLPVPGPRAALPGANGIKLAGRRILVSNTSRGELLEAAIGPDDRPGTMRTFSSTGSIDDFHIDADGSFIAATHASSVIRICRDGRVETIVSGGVDGATATAPVPGRRAIFVLTTGTPAGGTPGPAALIEAKLPDVSSCAQASSISGSGK